MKRPTAIGNGAAKDWILSLRADHALLYRSIPLCSGVNGRPHVLPRRLLVAQCLNKLQQIRVNDEAIVKVGMEVRAIAVGAIANIPVHMLAQGIVHAEAVPV